MVSSYPPASPSRSPRADLHIMFMQLTQQLAEGSTVPLTLKFETAGTVEVELMVGTINADEPACEHTEH